MDSYLASCLIPYKELTDKNTDLLALYDRFFWPFRSHGIKLLEIGVGKGGSMRIWQDYFPNGRIVGIDAEPPKDTDLIIHKANQTDLETISQISKQEAPDGWDIVIDDCSHIADPTRKCFWRLFTKHLRSGGLYCIEDWGTAYWPTWEDGEAYRPSKIHDVGMARLIHELVDECAAKDYTATRTGRGVVVPARSSLIGMLSVAFGVAIVQKSRD